MEDALLRTASLVMLVFEPLLNPSAEPEETAAARARVISLNL
jgi:hypothetical protein